MLYIIYIQIMAVNVLDVKEYAELFTELVKLITIFLVVYVLNSYSTNKGIFQAEPIDIAIYYALGVTFYHLVVKKLVAFKQIIYKQIKFNSIFIKIELNTY